MNAGAVLLVAVDRGLAAQLPDLLEPAGLRVASCQYGSDTVRTIEAQQPPLLVVDLSRLPRDGEMFCHQLSRLSPAPPLLAIVRPDTEAAVGALGRGAAACLSQPPDPSHLAAQVVALIRLARPAGHDAAAVVEVGNITIDHGRCRVTAGGKTLPLTPTEFRILSCLASTPGHVVSPSEVLRECTGLSLSDREAMELLKVHIYRLRRKLRAAGDAAEALRTARGFGYLLERRAAAKAQPAAPRRLRRSA